jgi:hypothetical protein
MSKHDEVIRACEALLRVWDAHPTKVTWGTEGMDILDAKNKLRSALSAAKAAPQGEVVACPDSAALEQMAGTMRLAIANGCVNVGVHPEMFLALLDRAAHPTPAAPARGEMERVAREAATQAYDMGQEDERGSPLNLPRSVIRTMHIDRAVAAATRGV